MCVRVYHAGSSPDEYVATDSSPARSQHDLCELFGAATLSDIGHTQHAHPPTPSATIILQPRSLCALHVGESP